MRLKRRRGVAVLAVAMASIAIQMCRTTVAESAAADDEQTAVREWLETYYRTAAERRYYAFSNASWNFNVNITADNNRLMVSE